ncbi:CRISPR-associated helicase Cas3' [Umezawaea sp. Da 62-37]|uniref:CRISPR-associated helicase Cas3' n=1 Tax=Umezawaea sp. Da 62-37 TaxID=3075927 RepID=UPI0028F6D3DA|nr:CRISPR-associated helicase Cas3' [Umezawaea sp. Da 62-37]WNV85004.1 CRISPR-associated helicase Cas3' [Umezawaea sp. Da 62-37]
MSSAAAIARELGCDPTTCAHLGALWGKSRGKAGGTTNLLMSHLFDTAAVAEAIWDHFLAPATKDLVGRISGGRGREFFAWICGIHDCGKATPAFQVIDAVEARRVRTAGLTWSPAVKPGMGWRHDKAGAKLLMDRLSEAGWSQENIDWVWPLVAGHHGLFPPIGTIVRSRHAQSDAQGRGVEWLRVQRAVVEVFTCAQGFDGLAAVEPVASPTRAEQLHLSGLVVMADWIASNEQIFVGIDDLDAVSVKSARVRAATAWRTLRLHGGWGCLIAPEGDVVATRFGRPARDFQFDVMARARAMSAPGLLVIEAPMGEGKTEAALSAAEILAARFGADGVFVGMPTQATCDPMFTRVRSWVRQVSPGLEDRVVLLHGKRSFNAEWKLMLNPPKGDPEDWYDGVGEDQYGMSGGSDCSEERSGPSEWLLGRLRGLLAPVVVGTIDQLLYAATNTKHVMLRMAGLVGKVMILDEVHAADVYMSQFLHEALRWLGQARVPVILLSATLAPDQRRSLVEAYLTGGRNGVRTPLPDITQPTGYPSTTTACLRGDDPEVVVTSSKGWRLSQPVVVQVLQETPRDTFVEDETRFDDLAQLVTLLEDRLAAGGCALVIRNDVVRAQNTYTELREHFHDDVWLLHGRLAVEPRAQRTRQCLDLLGPPGDDGLDRPRRMILVATQLAEQSFDVDVDLLVSDLAPIDLLLQRIGRLHRHDRGDRPEPVSTPTVVITGFAMPTVDAPRFLSSSEFIYGRYVLLRTADLVLAAADNDGWSVPDSVPALVDAVYSEHEAIRTRWPEDEQAARAEWDRDERERAEKAGVFLLSAPHEWTEPTLQGLSYAHTQGTHDQTRLDALVRDGDESVEVVILRHGTHGYSSYRGVRLGMHGELGPELLDDVMAGTVRLPASLTTVALGALVSLPEWNRHPWLKYVRALVLHDDRTPVALGTRLVSYDRDLGLVALREA